MEFNLDTLIGKMIFIDREIHQIIKNDLKSFFTDLFNEMLSHIVVTDVRKHLNDYDITIDTELNNFDKLIKIIVEEKNISGKIVQIENNTFEFKLEENEINISFSINSSNSTPETAIEKIKKSIDYLVMYLAMRNNRHEQILS